MKVLKNNHNKNTYIEDDIVYVEPYPRNLICENCKSELEYEKEDMKMGKYGCMHLDCPLCGYDNVLGDNELNITLTAKNIEFPTHFWYVSKESGAKDCCNNEEVKKCIYQAIDWFRKNKDEYEWITSYGNLFVYIHRYSGDECYHVYVANNYYNVEIPFENGLDY